jgi:sulfatase modifying factor 1
MKKILQFGFACTVVLCGLSSCTPKAKSAVTGWAYNDQKWGGFEKHEYVGQATGPNLMFIEGGTFLMGQAEEDVMFEYRAVPRRVTVPSFYMDQTEISNIDWREYLWWLHRVYGESYPEVVLKATPDTLVWREELTYNEPLVETYFRHPGTQNYPVVGVSWLQATDYCKWRTDRVNEMILIERGILNVNANQKDDDNFNTEAYLVGQYEGSVRKGLKDYKTGGERPVRMEDGILLPAYRLPTEAEWEFAALSNVGNQQFPTEELYTDIKMYPWNGPYVRYGSGIGVVEGNGGKHRGKIMANFKRGNGDYGGQAGALNDNAFTTAPVDEFYPNSYGLYNMAGNVNEWVMDVYRPLTSLTLQDVQSQDFNSFRGNHFEHKEREADGRPVQKDSLGRLKYVKVKDDDVKNRLNYQRGNVKNFLDGDSTRGFVNYDYGKRTLINDKARVYKGGSWADRAYYLTPGSRRFLDEAQATATIGFRCAMTRVGSSTEDHESGKNFGKKKKVKRTFK